MNPIDPLPLERLAAPPGLAGSPRPIFPNTPCSLAADNDIQACWLWIRRTSKTEADAHRKRNAVEKLLNWTYLERKAPLCEFTRADFDAFSRFLASPVPVDQWICPLGTARDSSEWRPFTRPLQPSAIRAMMSTLNGLLIYLNAHNYAHLFMVHGVRSQREGYANVAPNRESRSWVELNKKLQSGHWTWIDAALTQDRNGELLTREKLVLYFMYHGSLKLSEIEKIVFRDLRPPTRGRSFWWIKIDNGSERMSLRCIFLNEPLHGALIEWLQFLQLHPGNGESTTGRFIVPSRILDETLLQSTAGSFSYIVKSTLRRSAELANSEGQTQIGAELARLAASDIRNAKIVNRIEGRWIRKILDRSRRSTRGEC